MTNDIEGNGGLRWGVKDSFIDYVRRSGGSVEASEGVEASDDGFVFPRTADDAVLDPVSPTGVACFGGRLRFRAHAGHLDVVLGEPEVHFGDHGASLHVHDLHCDLVELATLQLGGAFRRDDGALDWVAVPVTLTSAGADTFGGAYPAYTEFEPLSLSLLPAAGDWRG